MSRWEWRLYWTAVVLGAALLGLVSFGEPREAPVFEIVRVLTLLEIGIACVLIVEALERMLSHGEIEERY